MKKLLPLLCLLGWLESFQQQPAQIREYKKVFTTYPFSDPSPIPLLTPVYPYFRYDGFTTRSIQKEWKVIEMENDYIRLLILPEIGGKIWTAIEKSTGKPFIYYNHVVKFRDIAMRGPWTSGGLEANYGIIGHTPNCATPVDYMIRTLPDGSVSCTIGALDLLTRSNWRMEIHLPTDKAYFTTQSFWYNNTPLEQPYYHWMNAGLKASDDLEFIYPGNRYLGHDGEYADWPVNKTNGKQITWYRENNFGGYKSYHVFGRYTNFSGAYWHNDQLGIVRYGTHDDKAGKKIWIWGLSKQGMIWEKLLTDTDGQYVEMQSGRLFNQNASNSSYTPFKHRSFGPYATDTWKEYWYPVLSTKGMVEANEYGALNLRYEGGWLKIDFSPVQKIAAPFMVRQGDRIVYEKLWQLHPLQSFADSVKISIHPDSLTVTLGDHLLHYQSNPNANLLNRPVESPEGFNWKGAYGLYLLGKEAMDEKRYPEAEEKLCAALQQDPHLYPALVKLAALLYRNMRYTEALELVKHALSIDTHAGDANYYYGLINAQLGQMVDAKDGFDLATLSPTYRSAAYTQLSKLYWKEKDPQRALAYALKATDHAPQNMDALQMQAVLYRQLKKGEAATDVLNTLLQFDPLNHLAGFEKYLWAPTAVAKKQFVANIQNELPAETFLETAIWYHNAGFDSAAIQLLEISPVVAETSYWLHFLQRQSLPAATIDPGLLFPFRSETATVLEQLLAKQPHWLLKYHLALIYKDRNRLEESKQLLLSCGNDPVYAPFYAVRAALFSEQEDQALNDLQRAHHLDPTWRYTKLLTELYIRHQQNEKALPLVESFYKAHPEQYIMGMLYAKTLLLNKRYAASDAVLQRLNIIPFEGAIEGHELYREAKLMQAALALQQKQYKKAITFINAARQWPENLGVGEPYAEDIDSRLEDYMAWICYNATRQQKQADALLQKIIAFTPRIDNTVKNFYPANAYVTAWAYRQLGQPEKAAQWLDQQIQAFPDNKILKWSKAKFDRNAKFQLTGSEKDANVRILEQLLN